MQCVKDKGFSGVNVITEDDITLGFDSTVITCGPCTLRNCDNCSSNADKCDKCAENYVYDGFNNKC